MFAVNGRRMLGRIVLRVVACAALMCGAAAAQAQSVNCPANLDTADVIDHNFTVSFCELCDVGTVRIEIENPFRNNDDADFSDIVVTENLLASGLTYVPGSTQFSGTNVAPPPVVQPAVSGANGSVLTWTLSDQYVLPTRPNNGGGGIRRLFIEFDVRRHSNVGEEGLVAANRNIGAEVTFTPSCDLGFRQTSSTGLGELPFLEPEPEIIKLARNLDAGQGPGSYTNTMYGHENDDAIWRIEVRNNGTADLQDLRFDDSMQPGNFEIDYICDNEGDATSAGSGGGTGSCASVGGVTNLNNVDVAQQFGGGANPYIVAPAGGSGFYYLVGRITDSCTNRTNSVLDVEWGCKVQSPAGGISATSFGLTAQDDAFLSTLSVENGLDVDVFMTGTNTSQPMGTKGRVRIRIRNQTGGTIKGGIDGLELRHVLPPEYVVDPTFDPVAQVSAAYGAAYPGMLDSVVWTNPQPNTYPLTTNNPALPLGNTEPEFEVTSSTVHPDFADQFNMLRHGDTLNVTFQVVLIDPQYYDLEAHVDVRQERPASDPPGTDPTESFPINSQTEIWWEEFCTTDTHYRLVNDNDEAEPEDLDIDVQGNVLNFILTNTDTLPLRVQLRNRGGHDADDYFAYVTFGDAMTVQNAPGACSQTSNPPPMPVWTDPVGPPASATIYECDVGVVPANATRNLNFQVVKNTDANAEDDLTFRADVIGEITLNDGTLLWFPTVQPRGDGITDRANNYTIDAVRARVVGYNLTKNQLGICSENNPPPANPDVEIQIGEECEIHIESGGWFGFLTPGYTYIAVQDIQVVDQIPNGQGYISSTDPFAPGYSTAQILNVNLNPPPAPLDEAPFDWTHNQDDPAERITEKDHWFRVDATTRLLNDPVDLSAPPNLHAAPSSNVLTSTFDAVFLNALTNQEEVYTLGPSTVGYPPEFRRRVDLTVTEPRLLLEKEVCNETIYGTGPSCTNFVPLADDGDAYDTYIYRVTVTNGDAAGGVTRAPAYDVTVTNDMDPTDLIYVVPLDADGLDNDGDGEIDEAGGEGQIIPDNTVLNGSPAQVIAAYDHSNALLRIDPGDGVVLYYRVDPHDDVAPLQQLVNSAYATYDSLENDAGNQSDPRGANGELGGARQYTSEPGQATIQIIPVEVQPKQILQLSNTPSIAPATPQPVSIGEEIEFELRTLIPVAQLRNFVIRDELPAGMRCADAPIVDLGAPPYDAAGFAPGGAFTPTCTNTEVIWDFGNQTVTRSPRDDRRFDFYIQFIARIDNVAANQDGAIIGNGGVYTVTNVSYVDELGNTVVIDVEAAEVVVAEPLLELQKNFSVETADASDQLTVEVTITNNGTATAYNPRILDDLTAVDLAYVGNVAGANPPPNIDTTTFGPESPLFSWDPGYEIPIGGQVSFTFVVQVDDVVEPLQVLENTVQADWTSLPGQDTSLNPTGLIGIDGEVDGMRIGALPNTGNALNDYEAEASDSVYVPPLAITKNDLDPALPPEIGAHKSFEVQIDLPEGVSNAVSLADDLASGNVSYFLSDNADFDITYDFVGIVSINGQAPDEAAFTAVPADGASGTATWDIGSVETGIEDDSVVNDIAPYIRATYSARINNDLVTDIGDTLQNSATVYFTNGDDGSQASDNDTTAAIIATEPGLTATKAIANVTPGKNAGDPIALGDIVQYTLTVPNLGNAIAHDVNIVDTLPPELALYAGYTPTAQIDGIDVAGFVGIPSGAPGGPLVWGAGNNDGSLDVAPVATLEVNYQVQLVAPADPSITLTNIIYVDWTSLNDASAYERTGAGCPTTTAPDDYCFGPASADGTPYPVGPPDEIIKAITQPTATIGEEFTYRISVPTTPHVVPLHDVRILDDLGASAANLSYVSVTTVSGAGAWTPVNTGTGTNLVIEDVANGIDIPVGQQIVLDITVRLDDTPTNVAGLTFVNTATYTYNRLDNAPATILPGYPGTSAEMTIVEPELTFEKTGPAQLQLGVPSSYTLNVHNIGGSPAYNTTINDILPNQADGGTCDVAPAQFTAQVFQADGTTPVSGLLAENTDFNVTFLGDPDCNVTLNMLTSATAIGPDQRLIITYLAYLDTDSQQGASLTDIAGATEWFSLDVSDPVAFSYTRTYSRIVTDGTVGTLDHEDAHTAVVFSPVLTFEKYAINVTSGEDPATVATPGDTIRYGLRVENLADTPLDGFSIVDELDRLNATPMFQAGTLNIVTLPPGATDNSNANGGAAGTGLLDISGLSLAGLGDSLQIEFEVVLAPVIANGSYVLNQSEASFAGYVVAISDDPNQNGPADPNVAGDEDPTQIYIESAPAFDIDKVSSYIDGNPNVLLAGETLRYTITVQNVGTDNATNVDIVDQIPGNTSYVPGSTMLNGVAVPDAAIGSPLIDGILINAPQDTTPGNMNAAVADNTATIIFDVVVYPDVPDGTIISNQAFVSAVDQGLGDLPSDDPRTPLVDDPTRDVVGNYPLLFAPKTAQLLVDNSSPGIVDPGDVLRYTITIYNNGAVPATAAELSDLVPADTTYVADSVTLNGLPVGQPDGGISPLINGIPVSSADLTPPLPNDGEGVINPGQSAVVQFDLLVNAAVPAGTLITNQATVNTAEVPETLTDGDGNPATGPEPTVVVVGDVQQLQIVKEVAVVGGGLALPGETLEYTVTVRNISTVPVLYMTIYDDLDEVTPGYITYVDMTATLNGLVNGIAVAGSLITADYFNEYGALDPGEQAVLKFRAIIDPSLVTGTTITNLARVSWDDPLRFADASVSIDVGAMPNAAILNGYVFHDADHSDTFGAAESPLAGWTVELLRDDQPIRTMLTNADGFYSFANVMPNYATQVSYSLRFRAPGAGSRTALLGTTDSDFTDGLQRIDDIEVQEGSLWDDQNMPIDPNGVVYNSVSRGPVSGAMLELVDVRNGLSVPSSCFDDPNQQGQVTVANGYYKFDINFSDPSCPSGLNYLAQVTVPNSNFITGMSQFIPPTSNPNTLPFDVPSCAGSGTDAVLSTLNHCEATGSEFAPALTVPARSTGTAYHLFLTLNDTRIPGTSQLFNNHIPLDPRLDGAVAVTKSTPAVNVTRGQMIPYQITVTNSYGSNLNDVTIVDRFPAGFRYVEGSARFDGVPTEPVIMGRELTWTSQSLVTDERHEIKLLLAVGAGVNEGEFINRALAISSLTGIAMSPEAEATVRLVPDPTFDCTDVTGKVFDDANRNGYQDGDETGLPGVRLVTARGLAAKTDSSGRYHITCAIVPHESRGSDFVLKLDDRTLPSGFRASTRPVQVQRATRGKALKINFGASIHRVVGLDIADPVFEPGSVEMRPQWRPRINLLLTELRKAPAVLRLSYVADVESESLVNKRLETLKKQIMQDWEQHGCCYELVVEPEVFWRLGGPPDGPRDVRE